MTPTELVRQAAANAHQCPDCGSYNGHHWWCSLPREDVDIAALIEEASAWRQYCDGSDVEETRDLVGRLQTALSQLYCALRG